MSAPLKVKRLISARAEVSARCADTQGGKKANVDAKVCTGRTEANCATVWSVIGPKQDVFRSYQSAFSPLATAI